MNIETALVAYLSTIIPQATSRIYPDTLPEKAVLPAMVYTNVSGIRISSHSGYSHYKRAHFQLDLVAATKVETLDMRDALINSAMDFRGTMGTITVGRMFIENEMSEYSPSSMRYWHKIDLIIWHEETF